MQTIEHIFQVDISYLSDRGKGNPFRVHLISGVGLPRALHFKETGGPGCKV